MQELMGQMRAAMERYEMIHPGDRVAVGVSGGKDSLVLLAALAQLRTYYPVPFSLVALTADPCFGGEPGDYTAIETFCRDRHIPYVIRRTRLGTLIFEERKEKNPCSLCARMRRGILHDMAKEQGCGVIALGHHFDDAVQTFLMNLFYGGRIGCFSPKSELTRKQLWLIRPMVFCEESHIRRGSRKTFVARCTQPLPRRWGHGPAGYRRTADRAGKKVPRSAQKSVRGYAAQSR